MSDSDSLPSPTQEPTGGESIAPKALDHVDQPATSDQVPATRQIRQDPWAHRRAEPRTFAFIWTLYLFVATLSTYAMSMTSGIGGHDVIRTAAQVLLALVGAGLVIIWPMVRLSQAPDPRPIAGPILDIVVVLVPIQAIVWPQAAWWLAGWPPPVVAAIAASTACWTALVGAMISIAHSRRAHAPRSPAAWMGGVLFVLILLHVPALFADARPAVAAPSAVRAMWMLSPVLSLFELSRDRSWAGIPAAVFSGHWRMIGLTGGVALGLWLSAAAIAIRDTGRSRGRGLH
jgi:hypothetical protein